MKADLNLIAIFDAIAQTGSVSGAAQRLSLSQPAVSHALKRMRDLTGDPLFTRGRSGMAPTPYAHAIIADARALATGAERLLRRASFDPATDRRLCRIGASDYAMLTLAPGLVSRIRAAAPNFSMVFEPVGETTLALLEEGALDLSFWGTSPPGGHYHYEKLFQERYVGIAAVGHPLFRKGGAGRIKLADYLAYPHLTVSLRDPGQNEVDRALAAKGKRRNIAVVTHSFVGNLECLKRSGLIATVPARLCRKERLSGLKTFELPIAVPAYDYGIVWHDRTARDPAMKWVRHAINM